MIVYVQFSRFDFFNLIIVHLNTKYNIMFNKPDLQYNKKKKQKRKRIKWVCGNSESTVDDHYQYVLVINDVLSL